jgi:putative AdoMet-dependent methyltransferase
MSRLPPWYYNELLQTGTDYTDLSEVHTYDQNMRKLRNISQEIAEVNAALMPEKHGTVIEIGTGTGDLAIALAASGGQVIAMDISSTMLKLAAEKAAQIGRNNIRFIQAGFLTYEHQGIPVDAVVSQLALHHLPDFWKWHALRRIRSWLKPGGILFLRDVVFNSSVTDFPSYIHTLLDWISKTVDEHTARETEVHIKEEYSTLDWIMEDLLRRAGFHIHEIRYYSYYLASYICSNPVP